MFVAPFKMFLLNFTMEFLSQGFRRKIVCEIERVISHLCDTSWLVEKKGTVSGDAYTLDLHVAMVLVLYLMIDIDCA